MIKIMQQSIGRPGGIMAGELDSGLNNPSLNYLSGTLCCFVSHSASSNSGV